MFHIIFYVCILFFFVNFMLQTKSVKLLLCQLIVYRDYNNYF